MPHGAARTDRSTKRTPRECLEGLYQAALACVQRRGVRSAFLGGRQYMGSIGIFIRLALRALHCGGCGVAVTVDFLWDFILFYFKHLCLARGPVSLLRIVARASSLLAGLSAYREDVAMLSTEEIFPNRALL